MTRGSPRPQPHGDLHFEPSDISVIISDTSLETLLNLLIYLCANPTSPLKVLQLSVVAVTVIQLLFHFLRKYLSKIRLDNLGHSYYNINNVVFIKECSRKKSDVEKI